jgi:hypothetical protein
MGKEFEDSSFNTPAEGTSLADNGTLFVNGGFESYKSNKKVNTGKPIGCDAVKRPHLAARVRVTMKNGQTKHLCQIHYQEAQKLQSHVIGSELAINPNDNTLANTLRSDKVINASNAKADTAQDDFYGGKEVTHVNATGRPRRTSKVVDGEEVENPVESVLNHVNTHGGHALPDDEVKMNIIRVAAHHANYPHNFDAVAFHTVAHKLGLTNPREREALFEKHVNHIDVENKPTEIEAATEDFNEGKN